MHVRSVMSARVSVVCCYHFAFSQIALHHAKNALLLNVCAIQGRTDVENNSTAVSANMGERRDAQDGHII